MTTKTKSAAEENPSLRTNGTSRTEATHDEARNRHATSKAKTREDRYENERAFWRNAEVKKIDLSWPLTPVVIQAVDDDATPRHIWPERRYTLDLRAPISREVRSAEDRKRLEGEFGPTFEALRRQALRLHRVAVTGQVIDPEDARVDAALRFAADLVKRISGRGEQITHDDYNYIQGMRLWLDDIPWGAPDEEDRCTVAATRADIGRALGAALGSLFSAVQLANSIQYPEEFEDQDGTKKPFDWASEPGIDEVFLYCRKKAERWLAVTRRLRGMT